MASKLIPQASVYKVVLPNAAALGGHLDSLPHEELQPSQAAGSGFIKIDSHGERTVSFPGGYAFALRYDEKIIPGSVVKDELKKRIARFKEIEDYSPSRKEQRGMREQIVAELCAKALVRTKVVRCFYHVADQLLILPTISRKLKDTVMRQLVRAVESMKSTTINVSTAKGSLTTRLENYMADQDADAFENFGIGERVVLVGPSGKSSFDLVDLTGAMQGVKEAIAAGAQVSEIGLTYGEGLSFRLTQDFLLKGIVFPEVDAEDAEAMGADQAGQFEHDAAVQLLLVSKTIGALCCLFDYTPALPDDNGDDLA